MNIENINFKLTPTYLYLKLIYPRELTSLEASNAYKKRHTKQI